MDTQTTRVRVCSALALLALCAITLAATLPRALAQPAPLEGIRKVDPRWHALVGAAVVTEPGRTVENATIVMRDGLIVSISDGPPPQGARVRDASGLTIYPGFIEPHLPVAAPAPDSNALDAHWNDKVTPQRSALDGEGVDESARKSMRSMGFAAAAIAPKDGVFRGSSAVVLLDDPAENDSSATYPTVVKNNAYQVIAFERSGWNARSYPGSEMGAIALVRQTLLDAVWHAEARRAHQRDPGRRTPLVASDALGALDPDDSTPLLFNAGSELEILRAAKVADEAGRDAAFLGNGREFRRLNPVVALNRPLIIPLTFPEKPSVATVSDANSVTLRELMTWEQAPTNARRLADAGADVSLTADKLRKGEKFLDNLREAVRHGLSPDDALAMLTTNPARLLGVEDRLGRIAPGAIANLVVADGDLFQSKTEIRDVWIAGRRHEVKAAPETTLAGEWAFTFGGDPEHDGSLTIAIDRSGKATATLESDDGETTKARQVKADGNRISYLVDMPDGAVVIASAVARGDRIHGVILTPGGRAVDWSASRISPQESSDAPDAPDEQDPPDVPEDLPTPFGAYGLHELPPQEDLVVTGATIWTGDARGVIEKGTLVVSSGKVIEVSDRPYDNVIGMRVIDATGKHITPGLIDAHSHTGISGGVNEGTHAVTSEVRIADVIDPDDVNWYRQLAGGLTAANQLHGSANPIGGQNSVVKLRWGADHPDDMLIDSAPPGIKFALGENVKQSNWGERFTTRYPQTRMGVETIIRDRFIAAREHAAAIDRYESLPSRQRERAVPPRRDLQLEALWEILDGERLIHCHSYRQDEILMLARLAQDFGFRIGTFQHVLEGYKVAEAIRESAIGASSFSDWWAYKFEVVDAIPYSGAIMHDVGVNVSFNSDSSELARRMNTEGGKAVKYGGVDPHEALKFVSYNPAVQLGVDDRVGSLAEGKDADFVIWSGDPLSYFSRAEATYVDGRELFSLQRDRELRQRDNAERERLIQKILASKDAKKDRDNDSAEARADDAPARADTPTSNPEADRHRELMLDILRSGGDPDAHRCGVCGVHSNEAHH